MTDGVKTALVVGAAGRFGRASSGAFRAAGYRVVAMVRRADVTVDGADLVVTGDATDPSVLIEASRGVDIIVNALNPPYPQWRTELPKFTAAVIAAAQQSGATVVVPGNVYCYGRPLPSVINEATPKVPATNKGRYRLAMEEAYQNAAARDQVQTVLVRAGDFIDVRKTDNWFEGYVIAKLDRGKMVYPGPTDRAHAWAFLPDLARACTALAAQKAALPRYVEVGFPGFTVTGDELLSLVRRLVRGPDGRDIQLTAMPWPMMSAIAWLSPMVREVLEMRYLWNEEHQLAGDKLAALIPNFAPTPILEALRQSIRGVHPKLAMASGEPSDVP